MTAIPTYKFTLRFPVGFLNMSTTITALRSIFRIDQQNRNSVKLRFVSNKIPKLIKSPRAMFCPLPFSYSSPRTNMRKIFQRYCSVRVFSNLHNLFTYFMIFILLKFRFFTRQFFQSSFCRFCSNTLKVCPAVRIPLSYLFCLFARIYFTIRSSCNIFYSKINSNYFIKNFRFFIRNIASSKQIKLSFYVSQIAFSLLKLQHSILMFANRVGNCLPPFNRPYTYFSTNGFKGKYATIISNTAKLFKLTLNIFIFSISIRNLAYTTDNHLCRKIIGTFKRMINSRLNIEFTKYFILKTIFRNKIASRICFYQSIKQQLLLLVVGIEFYLCCKFHNANIQYYFLCSTD